MVRKKKVPLRMCTGCREMKPKKELIRIVKNKDGEISVDFTGKKHGRGAYVCPNRECFVKARKGKKLEKTFEQAISDEIYEAIEKELPGMHEA